jgi:hypothetical protein
MAEPITAALVAAKQDEVRSLVRRLADTVSEATEVMARYELENALSGKRSEASRDTPQVMENKSNG